MLAEQDIQRALHASRVVPIPAMIHGPLGLEHLAEIVARIQQGGASPMAEARVERAIAMPLATWEKLQYLASATAEASSRPVAASEIAAAILEQFAAQVSGP